MSNAADDALVLAMALDTEDRTRGEQAALLRVARRLDRERNRQTATNRRIDFDASPIPCVAPWHDLTCKTCSVDGQPGRLWQHPFTAAAKTEPLVDANGWSIAEQAVNTSGR